MINFLKKIFLIFSPNSNVFVSLFNDEQGVKSLSQVKNDYFEVHKEFSDEKLNDNQMIQDISHYNVFKIYNNSELVASVFINKTKYYTKTDTLFGSKMKEEDALEIYSLFVNKKYRGKGVARELLYYALRSMKIHYKLSNSFIIGLHLNEADKFMNVSFSLYYSMNFRKGSFVKIGPSSYGPMFQMSRYFKDPIKIINEPSICNDGGAFFAMYTRYSEFLPFNKIRNRSLLEIGEKLRGILRKRRSKII